MRVIVTGGAGFIGSHLAGRLIALGHDVLVLDNLSTGARANVPAGAEFFEIDLGAPDCLASLPSSSFDAVCHLAAQSSGPASGDMPYRDLQSNAASTLQLSRWCIDHGVRRFLYASSMAVYGQSLALPVTEDHPCVPVSYYGVSKLASEHMLRVASQRGLESTSFRMFSVFGRGQNLANLTQGVVSIFMAYMLRGEEVPVTGSLDRMRDFVHVGDVVEAWVSALGMRATPHAAYNIAGGRGTSLRDLIEGIRAALDLPPGYPVRELAGPSSDQQRLYADISRAATDLNWRPAIALPDGLRDMAAWAAAVTR